MTADNVLHIAQESAWQLLIEFVEAGGPVGERQSVDRVTEAVGVLGVRPAESERIGTAVLQALRKATRQEERDQDSSPICIRVWMPRVKASDLDGGSSNAQTSGRGKRRGWGFFLLERREGGLQGAASEQGRVIELYLYQERQRAERHLDRMLRI